MKNGHSHRVRPRIAFFDHADVFDDFYPHYDIDQKSFATHWTSTGNHAFLALIQRDIGDVVWYEFALTPELYEARHVVIGCIVRFFASSWLHRFLWRLFYLPKSAWRWKSAYPVYSLFSSYLAPLSWHFLRTIWRDRPDVIFVQDYSTGRFDILHILARALGARFVAYHAGSSPDSYIGLAARRLTLPRTDALITSSERELDMLASRFNVPSTQLQTVLTPIDIDMFRPYDRLDACALLGLSSSSRYILFVGRLDDRIKRVSSLLRVFWKLSEKYTDADLIIIGDGPDSDSLGEMATRLLNRRCCIRGWVNSKEQLSAYYNVAECLVLPSISEGFPTVVGESIACGTPVAGSDVGGISELVIPGQTGWLFPPDDEDALRRALTDALEHPDKVREMRTTARKIALQRVAPAAVVQQLRECLLGKDAK